MKGYFRVSTHAVREIVAATDGPGLLAAYLVLCRFSYGVPRTGPRNFTAAGAKSIREKIGCTDWRSKRLLDELKALRFGQRGEHGLLDVTEARKKNAAVYRICDWPGEFAYMPSLFVDSVLRRLCESESDPEVIRDAIHLLIQLYAAVDYAGWMGAPPDYFAYQNWRTDGDKLVGDSEYELGHVANVGRLQIWAVAPPQDDSWFQPKKLASAMFGEYSEANRNRLFTALWHLLESGTAIKVAVVSDGKENYPLWIFNKAFRESLKEHHRICADLGNHMYRLASDNDADPDNYIIIAATDENRESDGTGLFFCLARAKPSVRTVLVPRLHAPTPINLDGLKEVSEVTQAWVAAIKRMRDAARSAA